MKWIKLLSILLILFILWGNVLEVYAQNMGDDINVVQLRAGGGGGGGAGGGGTGGTGRIPGGNKSGYYCDYRNDFFCFVREIVVWLLFSISMFSAAIILYLKVLRSSFNSKKYLKMVSNKDITWKYKNIEKQVIQTFYVVQRAWTDMNMKSAKEYMDENLYESFRQKLEWMEVGNKRNILKRIKLINLKPISVHDDEDDMKDLVWFYINGSMVDYMINTKTNEIIEGKNSLIGIPFVEFWKFTRKDDKWVLSEILQVNEKDKIMFQ